MAAARIVGEPSSWMRDGEPRAHGCLRRRLADSGVRLTDDRVAIGPGGITVIDVVSVQGRVRGGGRRAGRREVLRIDGADRTALVDGVIERTAAVRALLADHRRCRVDVRAALCLIGAEGLSLLRSLTVDGVLVDGPPAVADLAGRRGTLDATAIDALWDVLTTAS